jgi:hypothetical protein
MSLGYPFWVRAKSTHHNRYRVTVEQDDREPDITE